MATPVASRYDVVVIGAGAAGLSAAALARHRGPRVARVRGSRVLGGRGIAVHDEGFKINVGGHLIEDSGSGITKVFEHVGKELVHGAVSSDMAIWDNDGSWSSIRDLYSGRQERAQEGHQDPARHAAARSSTSGTTAAARVDAPAHQRRGRDRRCWSSSPCSRRSPRMVGPLGVRQPLHAQDALRGEAHGRLLVLARPGLGRHVARPADAIVEHGGEVRLGTRRRAGRHRATATVKGVAVAASPRSSPTRSSRRCSSRRLWSSPRCRCGPCCASCPRRRCPTGTSPRSATSPGSSSAVPGSASTSPPRSP